MRSRFQKGDAVVIASVLLLAALIFACFLPGGGDVAFAEIYMNGELLRRVSLSQSQEFIVTGSYTNTVTVSKAQLTVRLFPIRIESRLTHQKENDTLLPRYSSHLQHYGGASTKQIDYLIFAD